MYIQAVFIRILISGNWYPYRIDCMDDMDNIDNMDNIAGLHDVASRGLVVWKPHLDAMFIFCLVLFSIVDSVYLW